MSNLPYHLPTPLIVDGYTIDLSGGVTSGQALGYNGTIFNGTTVSGSGLTNGNLLLSPVDAAANIVNTTDLFSAVTRTATANQSGAMFYVTQSATCTGVKFYWTAIAESVKVSLWDVASTTRLANATITTSGSAGAQTASFGSVSLIKYKKYIVSVWQAAGGAYVPMTRGQTISPGNNSFTFYGGPSFVWINWNQFAATDVYPSSNAATEVYPVEPIFTVP